MYDDYEAAQEAYAAEPYSLGSEYRYTSIPVGEEYPEEYEYAE